jgi:hypothetical protein
MKSHQVRRGRVFRAWIGLFAGLVLVASAESARGGEAEPLNACGCRQNSAGVCFCEPKSKCGCPGECEPKGCADKRERQLKKEIDEETKRAKVPAAKGSGETPAPRAAAETTAPVRGVRQLSSAERRSLAHLLELYVAEHPDTGRHSVDDLRASLTGGGRAATKAE